MGWNLPLAGNAAKPIARALRRPAAAALILASLAGQVLAGATLGIEIDGIGYTNGSSAAGDRPSIEVGEVLTLTLKVTQGKVSQPVQLPATEGLTLNRSGTNPQPDSIEFNFFVTPTRAGDITIPAFDIRTDEGETLHVGPITLHAVGG